MANRGNGNGGAVTGLTRRSFLQLLGATGGSGAVWSAMHAWGLAQDSGQEEPPTLDGGGQGTRVVVLGAGPAGCTAAYELMNGGYDVRLLEARNRVGGHVFTVRRGDVIDEHGKEPQTCEFDESQFFDAGAWRIPYSHRATLHYCKEFGIALQPHKNFNLNAYAYMEGVRGRLAGTPVRLRELFTDMGGYTTELLAKATDQEQLDAQLTQEDQDDLIDYLVEWGLLSRKELTYDGSYHRGYAEYPGAGQQPGKPSAPIGFADLLPFAAETMRAQAYYLASTAALSQQETMLQPVGGMQRIYEEGFRSALGDRLTLNAEVTEIRQGENEVRVVYRDVASGQAQEVIADYCVCAIPLSVLIKIPTDVSRDMTQAMREVAYFPSGKLGLQFSRRFWEEDDWIYGGVTYTNVPEIGTIAYPDYLYQAEKGVIQAYYNFGNAAIRVSARSPQERIDLALDVGNRIHPQYRQAFETGVSVSWHLMPYALGAWPSYTERTRKVAYPRLLEPDGRIYLAGEHLSYVTAWQEGAIAAAWLQIEKLHQRVAQGG